MPSIAAGRCTSSGVGGDGNAPRACAALRSSDAPVRGSGHGRRLLLVIPDERLEAAAGTRMPSSTPAVFTRGSRCATARSSTLELPVRGMYRPSNIR